MPKREETVAIERMLAKETAKKRIYGCEEVTIGFFHEGKGNEHVDFMTIDSHDIVRCYEIKVTMEDLKSRAKKSFYGHYNYLVVTGELYSQIAGSKVDLEQYGVPGYAGIISCDPCYGDQQWDRVAHECKRKPKKQDLGQGQVDGMKSSLVRTLYWKMEKYKGISDVGSFNALKKQAREFEKKYKEIEEKYWFIYNSFAHAKHRLAVKYGIRLDARLDDGAEKLVDAMSAFIEEASALAKQ